MNYRAFAGLLIAPLATPVTVWLIWPHVLFIQRLLDYGPYSCAVALLVGVPVFLLYRKRGWLQFLPVALTGAFFWSTVAIVIAAFQGSARLVVLAEIPNAAGHHPASRSKTPSRE